LIELQNSARPDSRQIDGRNDMNVAIRLSIFAAATLLSLNSSGSGQSQLANMTLFVTSVGPGKGGDLGRALINTARRWLRRWG
jgi:hypothetical protein